jgi:hypothetical protein
MDRRERSGDFFQALRAAQQDLAANTWTALPGTIESYDPLTQSCTIQPGIQARAQQPDGSFVWVTLPLLVDCPVEFPSGGGLSLTFPVERGDEALVVFSSRCIDNWWVNGGVQTQADLRMHDLSDGFVFVGVSSKPNVMPDLSTDAAQLRDTPGTTRVEVTKTGLVNVVAATRVTVAAPRIDLNGDVYINGQRYVLHTHTGVTPGAANTGGVT